MILRPFRIEDLPALVAYRRQPDVARYQSWTTSFSMADAEAFHAEQQRARFGQPGAWVQLAAVGHETGTLYGDCAVRVADDQPATAEIGVTFDPAYQGRGLAREAVGAVVDELFEQFGIRRVYAETDDRNDAAQGVMEGLGFRCEARLVDADWFKNEWTTVRVYALLRTEWSG